MLPTVTPNLYHCSGQHIHVTYTPAGIDGQPHLTYQDGQQTKSFKGNEVRIVDCDLGKLISVTLRLTVDSGSTSFSLVIPRMQIFEGTTVPMQTHGVTTLHRFSIIPPLNHGQLDIYTLTPLHGTAQFVLF
jgi:hypothetical protein